MAFSDDIFLPNNQCEICGAELSDEVVIQEFADGSIARLCPECAAGADLQPERGGFQFPEAGGGSDRQGDALASSDDWASRDDSVSPNDPTSPGYPSPAYSASFDEVDSEAFGGAASSQDAQSDELEAMERTRELLTPVGDLISLQTEMQDALQRLATSLETFATGVLSENLDKTATVENRLEIVESELEQTRVQLRETEARLHEAEARLAAAGAEVALPARKNRAREAPTVAAGPIGAAALWDFGLTDKAPEEDSLAQTAQATQPPEAAKISQDEPLASAVEPVEAAEPAEAREPDEAAEADEVAEVGYVHEPPAVGDGGPQPYSAADLAAQSTPPPLAPFVAPAPVAPPDGPALAEPHHRPGFQLSEVQIAQKYFNESQYTARIRDVLRSLGRPKANLAKLIADEPRALLTIAWDIIWYQYAIDLRRDAPSDLRVELHRQGMDLDELTGIFKERNASIDDDGRLDASELEVKLLSDPSTLITEMTAEEEQALEDATEEIWDQKTAPEFKWDD